jgi:SAM-dependent MidA family methyltransferase
MNPSEALTERIRSEIGGAEAIPFARFMELALYAPELGYYERQRRTIGRRGDFYTSVSVGGLFGELLAFQFAVWQAEQGRGSGSAPPPFRLIEAGAHDGRLAADILGWWRVQRPRSFPALEYWIVEPSPRRQAWQQSALAEFVPGVKWVESLAGLPAAGYQVLFCNELLDAMPVHRLGWDAGARGWFEWGVAWNEQRFVWRRMEQCSAACAAECVLLLPDFVAASRQSAAVCAPGDRVRRSAETPLRDVASWTEILPDGYTIEVGPAAAAWWRGAAAWLQHGKLMAIDYGLTDEEWFRPERMHGTVRAFRHHHHSEDVLSDPGEQDLTAHVNFTRVQRAGEKAGLKTEALIPQGRFLTSLAARAWSDPPSFGQWTAQRTRQFQTLIHPEHLGRAFRVLIQSRSSG